MTTLIGFNKSNITNISQLKKIKFNFINSLSSPFEKLQKGLLLMISKISKLSFFTIFFFILVISTFVISNANADINYTKQSTCVLSFLPDDDLFNLKIKESLQQELTSNNSENIIFKTEAQPKDLAWCAKQNVSEITIVAHSSPNELNSEWINLVYYTKYGNYPFTENMFNEFLKIALSNKSTNFPLRQIRWVVCEPHKIFERYNLEKKLKELNIKSILTPTPIISYFLFGIKEVTPLNPTQVRESFQFNNESEMNDEEQFFGYIHAKTFLLYRTASGEILRGKYTIDLNGIAFGLEEKWKMIWFKYSDVKNLKIGETKSIDVPTLDFSISLLILGSEINLFGKELFESPLEHYDPNSFGSSLGVYNHISITRNY